MNNSYGAPESLYSKLVGCTFGKTDKNGIPLKQLYLKKIKELDIKLLDLVREPDNVYDPCAIAIFADISSGRVHLGYVQNSKTVCLSCSAEAPKVEPTEQMVCRKCGGQLVRDGLATTLCKWMDEGYQYRCRVSEVTGGPLPEKNLGLNIRIERVV